MRTTFASVVLLGDQRYRCFFWRCVASGLLFSWRESLSAGQSIFDTVTAYLTTANGVAFKRIKFQDDKLSGLGDGAWMQFKSTSELFREIEILSIS